MTVMQGQSNIRFVDIPQSISRGAKGATKYDDKFDAMISDRRAIRMPEDEFDSVRKAAFRFLEFRGLKGKLAIRQRKDAKTRSYTIWFTEVGNDQPV